MSPVMWGVDSEAVADAALLTCIKRLKTTVPLSIKGTVYV